MTVGELAHDEHVVVAGLSRSGGRALLVHRSPHRRWYPDAWDLPGGHVTYGETPAAAVAREVREELGIAAEVTGAPFARVQGTDFRMDIWVIDHWSGDPSNRDSREHDALAWLTEAELGGLVLADPRIAQLLRAALHPAP